MFGRGMDLWGNWLKGGIRHVGIFKRIDIERYGNKRFGKVKFEISEPFAF